MESKEQSAVSRLKYLAGWLVSRLSAIPQELRIVFSTLFFGYIIHGFAYANTLFGHDNTKLFSSEFTSLRWSALLFYSVRAFIQIPWVIGLIALLELGIVNVLLARLLSLRRMSSQLLLVLTVLTYPSVVAFHNFGAVDIFTGSLLLCVLAVYFYSRKGVLFTALSLLSLTVGIATYQAFVCMAAVLMLAILLERLTIRRDGIKAVLLSALKAFLILVVSIALYYLVYRLLDAFGLPGATDYRGQDQMGVFALSDLPAWLLKTYVSVLRYLLGKNVQLSYIVLKYPQLFCMGVVLAFAVARLAKEGFFKQPARPLLALLILALLPFAMNAIQFLNSGESPHMLMTFAYIAPWLLVLQYGEWLLRKKPAADRPEIAEPAKKTKKIPVQRVFAVLCTLLICANAYYGYIVANADYLNRKVNYDASISLATRLVDRIENVDGYTPETPVAIVGNFYTDYAIKRREGFELTYSITGSCSKTGQAMTYNSDLGSTIQWFIADMLSSNMVFISSDELEEYAALPAVTALQSFPEKNCYTWVDGVLVIKLSD